MKQTPVWKLLLKLSPPVMLALLIQSVYNIVDSYFVAKYSAEGLTAHSAFDDCCGNRNGNRDQHSGIAYGRGRGIRGPE